MMGKPAGGSNSASRFSFCMMFWRCDSCKKSALTNPEKWDKLKRMQRRRKIFYADIYQQLNLQFKRNDSHFFNDGVGVLFIANPLAGRPYDPETESVCL